jgi:predicted small lipoprotein YifL
MKKGTTMVRFIRFLVAAFAILQKSKASLRSIWLMALIALSLSACGGPLPEPRSANTCDLSDARSGAPDCLPPPAFFCITAEEAAKQAENQKGDPRFIAQGVTVLPSKYSVGPNLPICPPNGTRLTQDQDWKDARNGAKAIAHEFGRIFKKCENIVDQLSQQPDLTLVHWNNIDPATLEMVFDQCTSELDKLPAIPEYEDPWLAGAAAEGFKKGYGEGVDEIANRLLLLEIGMAAVEMAITGGAGLVKVAVTRGMRMSLAALRRVPIFIPGAVGGIGAVFQKGAPRVVAKVVEGSSRRLGNNLMAYLKLFPKAFGPRLPGEFAHHIVAHGDPRALEALEILKKFGIHVDDWENGVFLPGYKTSPNLGGKIVHGNLHTDAYYRAVNTALKGATSKADAIRQLRIIAFKLEHGMMP